MRPRYHQIIRKINQFRNKDRPVLARALLFSTIHTIWTMIVVGLCASIGWANIKLDSLLNLGLKIFLILFIFIIIYNVIIKIYIKFFKKWDFK